MVEILKKLKNGKFPSCSHSRGTKCRDEAKKKSKSVVACARCAVKRPNKRSALVRIKSGRIKCVQLENTQISRITK